MDFINAANMKEEKATYLVYAPPGMGKTTAIKHYPGKTLVLDIDRTTRVLRGCENIDILKVDNVNTWKAWQDTLVALPTMLEKIKWNNIVVDNISELERCILSDLGSKGKNNGVPCQGDYQFMQFKLVNSLRFLKQMDANIILNAWETTEQYTDANGQQFNRTMPMISPKILSNICGLCDIVARLNMNEKGERGFYLTSTGSVWAKNQLDDRKGCPADSLILPVGEIDETPTIPE